MTEKQDAKNVLIEHSTDTKKLHFKNHPTGKVFFGNTNEVTPVYYNSYNELSKNSTIKQNMDGFDKKYCDFVDYILRITHNILGRKRDRNNL